MVALDDLAGDVHALDAVGIDGALRQPFHILNLGGFLVKHLDEIAADDFAFLLRVGHTGEILVETFRRIHAHHVEAQPLVVAHHIAEFVLAQQAVVHEDAGQTGADGLVEQDGRDGRVHAAAQAQHHLVVAQLGFQLGYRAFDKRVGGPFPAAAANAHDEIFQQEFALEGMHHLGVELHTPGLVRDGRRDRLSIRIKRAFEGGVLHASGGAHLAPFLRDGRDGIPVAHPDLGVRLESLEQRAILVQHRQGGTAVFPRSHRLHFPAVRPAQVLGAVADAQHGITAQNAGQIGMESVGGIDAQRRAAQNDADDVRVPKGELVVREDFTKGVHLAHPTADELGGLRAKIQNNDFLHGCGG